MELLKANGSADYKICKNVINFKQNFKYISFVVIELEKRKGIRGHEVFFSDIKDIHRLCSIFQFYVHIV